MSSSPSRLSSTPSWVRRSPIDTWPDLNFQWWRPTPSDQLPARLPLRRSKSRLPLRRQRQALCAPGPCSTVHRWLQCRRLVHQTGRRWSVEIPRPSSLASLPQCSSTGLSTERLPPQLASLPEWRGRIIRSAALPRFRKRSPTHARDLNPLSVFRWAPWRNLASSASHPCRYCQKSLGRKWCLSCRKLERRNDDSTVPKLRWIWWFFLQMESLYMARLCHIAIKLFHQHNQDAYRCHGLSLPLNRVCE